MALPNIASLCVQDIMAKIQRLPDFVEKAFYVYDYDILNDASQELMFPCLGVVYEGLTTQPDTPASGLSTRLTCGIFLIAGDRSDEIRGVEDKGDIVLLLDNVRNVIKNTQSPTGHKWKFMMEIPFDINNRGLGYYQRWRTVTPLT